MLMRMIILYRDKDYLEECRLIDRLLQTYGNGSVRSLLDLGCGTGNHALPLAERGYEVVGVDRSAKCWNPPDKKAASGQIDGKVNFYRRRYPQFSSGALFDASLMMFAVLGYQLENRDVLAALRTARKHLRSGGLFVFDVWYGPAVLRQGPSERVKLIPTDRGQILRCSLGRARCRTPLVQGELSFVENRRGAVNRANRRDPSHALFFSA